MRRKGTSCNDFKLVQIYIMYINEPSKEECYSGMRQRKIGDWDLRILYVYWSKLVKM